MSIPPVVNEQSTATYSCQFVDATGADISDTAISAIVATLRDVTSGAIINSRNGQSVLNANGGTLAVGGAFTLVLSSADNVAVAGGPANQLRRLTLKVTYTSGVVTTEFGYVVKALEDIS